MTEMPAPIRRQVSKPLTNRNTNAHPYEWLGDPTVVERKDEIIAGVFGASEVVVLHADTKVGKTQFATDLSFKIATGDEWFGRKVKHGKVLYLAIEKGRVTKKRFRALQRLHGNIRPPVAISTTPFGLSDRTQVDGVIAAAQQMADELPVVLIVVDTLNRATAGIDENSAGLMGQVFNSLTRIAEETGAAILVLHHNVKGGSGLRGSTVIAASADVVISLDRLKDDDLREATVDHANDTAEGQQFRFQMEVVEAWPATPEHDAERTVVIRPLTDTHAGGAPLKGAPSQLSKADRHRSEEVLKLFDQLAFDGRLDRAVLLSAARDQHVVAPNNPNSSSEQLRRALLANKEQGQLDFNSKEVWAP
jgi:hypothetical protein